MNKIIKNLWVPVIFTILFGTCKTEGHDPEGEPQTIRFEMVLPTLAASGGASQTGVNTDIWFKSSWTDGDKVGVYITPAGEALKESGNWVENLRLTYNNGTWESADVYYPFVEGLTTPNRIMLSLETDQRDKTAFDKNHILTANVTVSHSSDKPVRLDFKQRLAMLELKVIGGGLGAAMSPLVVPTLRELRTTVNIDLSGDELVPTGSSAPVTMCRVGQPGDEDYNNTYTYRALVHEENYRAGHEFVLLTQGTTTISHIINSTVSLKAGEVKPYTITLTVPTLQAHSYSVGDPYPYLGFPMGIVYQVTNGGLSGRIVSLESSVCAWSTEEINLSTGSNDGLANMQIVKDHDGSYGQYPAFRWVDAHNPEGTVYTSGAKNIWYLPSLNELHDLFKNVWKPSMEELDQKMELAGGVPFPVTDTTHWSSTGSSSKFAYFQGFVAGGCGLRTKISTSVRSWIFNLKSFNSYLILFLRGSFMS